MEDATEELGLRVARPPKALGRMVDETASIGKEGGAGGDDFGGEIDVRDLAVAAADEAFADDADFVLGLLGGSSEYEGAGGLGGVGDQFKGRFHEFYSFPPLRMAKI